VRWAGSDATLGAVGTGSHTDAIPHAGMYDGTVGVLGGLEAMRSLKEAGFQPKRSIELLIFTSEEPTRFGIGCIGSRLLGGVIDPETADALPDRLHESDSNAVTGGTLREVREAAGFSGALRDVKLPRGYYDAWVELHIEQGPLLEREGVQLGVVTDIAAPASYRYTVEGVGGHAGALLMPDRHDALCAAAEVVLAVERRALEANARAKTEGKSGVDTVATVGMVAVHPGAVNSVPSRVQMTLDIRDTDVARREGVMRALREDLENIEQRRGVPIAEERINADAPAQADERIVRVLEEACREEGASFRRMVSRAYHDTSFMAAIAPVAMLFLPCRNGVTHRPDEYAAPEAIALGTAVLARTLAKLSAA
jgi:N-carbamoyl-L-amino-acid hydrolase